MIRFESPEDVYQFELLTIAAGVPNSGTMRYAAAMYFQQRGMISAEALEVYRICSPLDDEDPGLLLASRGLDAEVRMPSSSLPPSPEE